MVSGPPAVGKTTVAKALGEKFNLQYVSGGDVLKEIASECGFNTSGDDWWDTSDGLKFLKIRSENDEYDRRVDEKLAKAYSAGGAVMTSYTIPWISQGGIKIWLGGSHKISADRMQSRDGMDEVKALEVSKKFLHLFLYLFYYAGSVKQVCIYYYIKYGFFSKVKSVEIFVEYFISLIPFL